MDATREHLWGQLLVERRVVAPPELAQLTQARDQYIRQGHDCSIAGLLMHHQRLDQNAYTQLQREVEGRGRACPQCQRVFLAPNPHDPPACPACGGHAALGPPGSGAHQAHASGQFHAPPGASGRFRAQPGTGHYPAASGRFQAHLQTGQFQTGHFQATPHPSGRHPRPSGAYGPPGSGRYTPPGQPGVAGSVGGYSPQADQLQPSLASLRWSARSTPAEQQQQGGDVGVGKRFGRYEILDELGRGGMGVVYKVREPGRPQCYALKVLLAGEFASPKLLQRFRDEAEVASKLRHPNIVAVQDVGEVDGIPYYSMDYVKGSELQDLIRQKNLSVRRGAEILVEVARAAHHAHEHGVVHRDLKPSNVLIAEDGTPYIMDFGLAKNLEADKGLTRSGVAIGTPYYMPPEQARGQHREMDARSDVYAIGAILYEILTRRVPFTAKTQNELLRKIIENEPQPPRQVRAQIPSELEVICLKALQKDKQDRYASALALADDLGRFLSGMPIQARPLPIWVRAARKAKKNKQATIGVAVVALVVLIAIGAVISLTSTYDEEAREREQAAEQRLLEQQAQQAAEQAAQQEQLAAQQQVEQKRKDADLEVNRALEYISKARMATSASPARDALRRAEEALTTAIGLESQFTDDHGPRPATAYRRGLVRRDLCRWKSATEDFQAAGNAGEFVARAKLHEAQVSLRAFGDERAARELLERARQVEVESHQTEERGAQDIAAAYLDALDDRLSESTRTLARVLERGDVTLSSEANGAWAYVGTRLEPDQAGERERALSRAELAVQSEKFRYFFVIDMAQLLARDGKLEQALALTRTARALDANAPGPDLVQALVHRLQGREAAMRESLQSAREKARARGPRALDAVRVFEAGLDAAQPTGSEGTPRAQGGQNQITDDTQATINFAPGSTVIRATLVVRDDAQAVKLKLAHVDRAVRMIASFGTPITSADVGDHVLTSAEGDHLVLVLRRDQGEPPLRTGTYHLAFLHPKPQGTIACTLQVTYFEAGEELPQIWDDLGSSVDLDLDRQYKAEADRLVQTFVSGQGREQAVEGWEALEERAQAPQLAIIRSQWLTVLERYRDALTALDKVAASEQPPEVLSLVEYLRARNEWLLDANQQAIKRLRALLEDVPAYLDARMLLAQIHLEEQEDRQAYKVAESIRKRDPDQGLAVVLSAISLLAADDGTQGRERLEQAIESNELSQFVLTKTWGQLLSRQHGQLLLDLLDKAVAKQSARGDQYPLQWELYRGQALAQVGQVDEALKRLQTVHGRVSGTEAKITVQKLIDTIKADAGR